jgi:hypothetical protein
LPAQGIPASGKGRVQNGRNYAPTDVAELTKLPLLRFVVSLNSGFTVD